LNVNEYGIKRERERNQHECGVWRKKVRKRKRDGVTSRERGNDKTEIKKRMCLKLREGIKNDKLIKKVK
jgi:hypothetical protein